ncbi:unnamed protein product, partial [Ectocarpus sp. 6 AP-2014]
MLRVKEGRGGGCGECCRCCPLFQKFFLPAYIHTENREGTLVLAPVRDCMPRWVGRSGCVAVFYSSCKALLDTGPGYVVAQRNKPVLVEGIWGSSVVFFSAVLVASAGDASSHGGFLLICRVLAWRMRLDAHNQRLRQQQRGSTLQLRQPIGQQAPSPREMHRYRGAHERWGVAIRTGTSNRRSFSTANCRTLVV